MIYFDLDLIISILISMNNIEKYVDNFENAYEKVSKQLLNIDDEIYPNFDSLNESDKLFLFAKKLIMKNDNFLNIKRIAELEKEVQEKNEKLIQLQNLNLFQEKMYNEINQENNILDEDCYAYKLKFNMYKKKYEELLEKNNKLKEKIRQKINDMS